MNAQNCSTHPCRLLIIDDHNSLRRNLAALLEDENFAVSEAESGEQALNMLQQNTLDVAIVDMRLPGMSGSEFIEQAAARFPALRFIVHTGSVDYVLSDSNRALGISESDVFYKPIADLQHFFQRIRSLCPGGAR